MMGMARGYRQAQEFAELLESSRTPPADHPLTPLVVLSRSLHPTAVRPGEQFRADLRERLVAEAAARPIPAQRGAQPDPASRPRRTSRRLRHVLAAATAMVIATSAGAAVASSAALPGDSLYGLKRGIETLQLRLALSDQARGVQWLEQAGTRLDEAQRLVAADRAGDEAVRPTVAALLTQWSADTAHGAQLLTDVYRETGDPEPIRILDRFATEQREQLQDLLAVLDPALREQVRAALVTLDSLRRGSRAVLAAAGDTVTGTGEQAAGPAAGLGSLLDPARELSGLVATLEPSGSLSEVPGDLSGSLGGAGSGASTGGTSSSSGGGGSSSSGTGSSGDPVGDLVGGIVGSVTSPAPSSGLPGASTLPSTPLPTPTTSSALPLPVPTPSNPLPSSPLPSIAPSTTSPTSLTSPLPTVTTSLCLPLPLPGCP